MQTKFLMAISLASACSLAVGQATADVTLLNDTFEIPSGTATAGDDAADAQDTAWYSVGSDPTLAVTGAAGSRVLNVTLTEANPFVGGFASTSLVNTGDSITLSLDLQFPGDRSGGNFRIGLFNDGASPNTGDNQGVNNDDAGYFLQLATPNSGDGTSSLQKSTSNLFGSASLVGSNTSTGIAKDKEFHTLTLTIARTDTSEVTLTGTLTGATNTTTSFSRVDTSGLLTTFNEIGIRYSAGNQYNIDNVVVTTTIPEPGSLMLALSGVALCVFRSRR